VAVGVALGLALGVLLGVTVGARVPPSQPPAHTSMLSNRVLLHPADTQSVAQTKELATASSQKAAPTQLRHRQHMASALRGVTPANRLTRSTRVSALAPFCTPLPRLDRLRIAPLPVCARSNRLRGTPHSTAGPHSKDSAALSSLKAVPIGRAGPGAPKRRSEIPARRPMRHRLHARVRPR